MLGPICLFTLSTRLMCSNYHAYTIAITVTYLIWYFAKFVEVIIWKFPIEDNHIFFDPIWVG